MIVSCTCDVQAGDAFDIATLLCSLLLGIGYDAFVAMGHAPEDMIQGITDQDPCPQLSPSLHCRRPGLCEQSPLTKAGSGAGPGANSRYMPSRRIVGEEDSVAEVSGGTSMGPAN